MSYQIVWDDTEQTKIRLEFYDRWTWDDWVLGHDEMHAMVASVPHHVDIIACFHTMMPRGNAIPNMKRSGSTQPPNARHTVFVNHAGPMFRQMVDTVVGVMGWTGPMFCTDVHEARVHLHQLPYDAV